MKKQPSLSKATAKSKAASAPASQPATDAETQARSGVATPQGDVGYEAQIPLDQILPGPNPRQYFDPKELQALADSLAKRQLQNITVRAIDSANYELIGGERRLRAAKLAGLSTLRARVIQCDDATAIELRGIENYRREQLNAVEEALWFHQMLGTGKYNQTTLAEYLNIDRSQVSNRLRLLDLPADWQQMIMDRRLPPTHARYLVPWVGRPALLKVLLERNPELATTGLDDMTVDEFQRQILLGLHSISVDAMEAQFELTDELRQELDVVLIPMVYNPTKRDRIFNVERFRELNAIAIEANRQALLDDDDAEAEDDANDGANSDEEAASDSSPQPARHAETHASSGTAAPQGIDDFVLRCHFTAYVGSMLAGRIKPDQAVRLFTTGHVDDTLEPFVRWLQARDGSDADEPPEQEDAWEASQQLTARNFATIVHEYLIWALAENHTWLTLPVMMTIADELRLDPLKQWQPDEQLLSKCTDAQLRELFSDEMAPAAKVAKWNRKRLLSEAANHWPQGYLPALLTPMCLMSGDPDGDGFV